jgi:hypothetical protein
VVAEQRIILEIGIYLQLFDGGAAPRPELHSGALTLSQTHAPTADDNTTVYAESILVRELVRHMLYRAALAEEPALSPESAPDCRGNRILHQASLAQTAYLSHRGVSIGAHIFSIDPRCRH